MRVQAKTRLKQETGRSRISVRPLKRMFGPPQKWVIRCHRFFPRRATQSSKNPNHASVGHNGIVWGWSLVLQPGADPGNEDIQRFPTRWRLGPPVCAPCPPTGTIFRVDGIVGTTLPFSKVHLAQPWIGAHRHRPGRRQTVGQFCASRKVGTEQLRWTKRRPVEGQSNSICIRHGRLEDRLSDASALSVDRRVPQRPNGHADTNASKIPNSDTCWSAPMKSPVSPPARR